MTLAHLGADAKPNCVYRYYDHAGRILYVGITARGPRRQDEHNATSEFFQHVRSQQVEQCHSRDEALRLERELIKAYRPPFNRQHNEDWEPLRAAYLGIVAAEEAYVRAVAGLPPSIVPCDPCACSGPGCDPCEYGKPVESRSPLDGASGCGRPECVICHARFHGVEEGLPEGYEAGVRAMASTDEQGPCGHCEFCRNPPEDPEMPGGCEHENIPGPCEHCGRGECLWSAGRSEGSLDGYFEGRGVGEQIATDDLTWRHEPAIRSGVYLTGIADGYWSDYRDTIFHNAPLNARDASLRELNRAIRNGTLQSQIAAAGRVPF